MDMEISHFNMMKENEAPNQLTPSKVAYKQHLATALFDGKVGQTAKILSFKSKAPTPAEDHINQQRVLYSLKKEAQEKKVTTIIEINSRIQSTRYVPDAPFKILDAPNFSDDYYVNVVDWSKDNSLAIGLGSAVYLLDASIGAPVKLNDFEDQNIVSSVNWSRYAHLTCSTCYLHSISSNCSQRWKALRSWSTLWYYRDLGPHCLETIEEVERTR